MLSAARYAEYGGQRRPKRFEEQIPLIRRDDVLGLVVCREAFVEHARFFDEVCTIGIVPFFALGVIAPPTTAIILEMCKDDAMLTERKNYPTFRPIAKRDLDNKKTGLTNLFYNCEGVPENPEY